MRVLKPGQNFACYEWCLTDHYDKDNATHRLIKKQIEEGDGLPDTAYTWEMDEALRKVSRKEGRSEDTRVVVGNGIDGVCLNTHPQVGFEIVETKDIALTAEELGKGGKTW